MALNLIGNLEGEKIVIRLMEMEEVQRLGLKNLNDIIDKLKSF